MKHKSPQNPRLGTVGGQAVLEGVMMRCRNSIAIAVRRADGTITLKKSVYTSVKAKYKFFRIFLIRGIVNFIEMMILSVKTLTDSADMLGEDMMGALDQKKGSGYPASDEPFKIQLTEKKSESGALVGIVSALGTLLGVALAVLLFMVLPTFVAKTWLNYGVLLNISEMLMRIIIFIIYIALVGLMPDIRRTFEYHGAEHMSVFCYEDGLEMTVENARKKSRFHPRCGTSFLVVLMVVGLIISFFIPHSWSTGSRILMNFLLLPIVIGLGYEFIGYAGRSDNLLIKIVSAPGLWVQRLTTRRPSDAQLEVGIAALLAAVEDQQQAQRPRQTPPRPPFDNMPTPPPLPSEAPVKERILNPEPESVKTK